MNNFLTSNKLLLAIATAAGIASAATVSLAAPLPAGTQLKITPTTDGAYVGPTPCTNGSCFGMLVLPGMYAWTPIFPGTDGGIVINKPQQPGEINIPWEFGGNTGTFFTAPDSTGNIFDDASCTGSGCLGKTELKVWNTLWAGMVIPMGSASGCDPALFPSCTPDQAAGIFVKNWTIDSVAGTWSLEYNQVVKEVFPNYPFELVLRGASGAHVNLPPVANNVQVEGAAGAMLTWMPVVSDSDGPKPLTCFIGTPPANGVATVAADCSSGSYISGIGFSGIDSFTYGANDGLVNSNLATVTAATTGTPSTACTVANPVKQVTYNSKSKLTMVVTGNIRSNNNHEVRICPTTRLEYNATSTVYPVTCYINNAVAAPKGSVAIGTQLKCNVKPYAGDQYKIRIKSAT